MTALSHLETTRVLYFLLSNSQQAAQDNTYQTELSEARQLMRMSKVCCSQEPSQYFACLRPKYTIAGITTHTTPTKPDTTNVAARTEIMKNEPYFLLFPIL